MLSPQEFRRIVSCERRDLLARCARPLLSLATFPYGWVVSWRNYRFDADHAEQHQVDVPVICVGNLTVGGTGKTPMVAFLCRWFRKHNVRVAIVSRGYGADAGQQNDEARELSSRLPDVPHIQNPDRVAAATVAADELEMQVVVLDDGFQHRRLRRDLDLVLIDALEPFGFERLLPRGLLREPIHGLRRAHVVALTRANLISEEQRSAIRQRVAEIAPDAGWLELIHAPVELSAGEQSEAIEVLHGKRVLAFCGLGNPVGFRHTLEDCGAEVIAFQEFPDHHQYQRDDIELLRELVRQHRPDFIICTHKDMVKIELDQLDGLPLRALLVDQQIQNGQSELETRLNEILNFESVTDS